MLIVSRFSGHSFGLCVKKMDSGCLFFGQVSLFLLPDEGWVRKKLLLCIPKSINMNRLREEIINKAFALFLSRGYHACSLKDLETATGLTKGAFYYYFRNKEEILKEGLERYATVMEEISGEEFERVGSLKEYIDVVVDEKVCRIERLQELFGLFIIEELYFQLVLEVEKLFPAYRRRIDELSKQRLSRWEKVILKAKQSGEIKRSLDTSILARNLMSVSGSMVNIELSSADLRYAFSDMRLQYGQYYMLIKNKT